ncbi:hypothetical protein HDV02_003692, partial [Globomyces sp. JEL0801]
MGEFKNAYNGNFQPEIVHFKPYVQYVFAQDKQKMKSFWLDYLSDFELGSIFLPKHTSNPTYGKIDENLKVSRKTIKEVSSRLGTTEATVCKLAWALTLSSLYRRKDIVFGEVVSGRDIDLPGIERMGAEKELQRLENATIGLAEIEKLIGTKKLLESLFLYQNYVFSPNTESGLKSVQGKNLNINSASFPLELIITPKNNSINVKLLYRESGLLNRNIGQQILSLFQDNIGLIVEARSKDVYFNFQNTITNDDYEKLLEFGTGPVKSIDYECAHYAFEHCVQRDPNAIAVEQGDESITYGELNLKAEKIAACLIRNSVQVGDYVGILGTRSIDMICGMLGSLKAGSAYIPIDASLPMDRVQYMVQQTKCKVVICEMEVSGTFISKMKDIKFISSSASIMEEGSVTVPYIGDKSPAYVVFTSGSTGNPKGVYVSHGSITNYCINQFPRLTGSPLKHTKWASLFSMSFDMFTGEVLSVLSNFGTLCLPNTNPFETIQAVDYIFTTPSFLKKLNPNQNKHLKAVLLVGEPLSVTLAKLWYPTIQLINTYGPSEATIIATSTQ